MVSSQLGKYSNIYKQNIYKDGNSTSDNMFDPADLLGDLQDLLTVLPA